MHKARTKSCCKFQGLCCGIEHANLYSMQHVHEYVSMSGDYVTPAMLVKATSRSSRKGTCQRSESLKHTCCRCPPRMCQSTSKPSCHEMKVYTKMQLHSRVMRNTQNIALKNAFQTNQ